MRIECVSLKNGPHYGAEDEQIMNTTMGQTTTHAFIKF